GGHDIGLGMDGARAFGRQLGDDPVRVAVPYAPGGRGIGARQFLENLQTLCRCEIEPAIGLGQKDSEEPLTGELARQIFRETAPGLDAIALGQDARAERAGGVQQRRSAAAIAVAHQSCCAWKVLQPFTSPLCRPRLNQRTRCALVPWVKLSGTTRPCAW